MRVTTCLLLLAALAACSTQQPSPASNDQASGAGATAAASGSLACDVLTEADAEKALGREVARLPNDGGPAGLDICQYGYQGEKLADMGNVSVTVQALDLASVKSGAEAQGYKFEAVPDLGDEAYYSADIGLYVGKGQRTAIYLIAANGMDDPRAEAIALARDTVGRL